jgi:hypothetical protein
LELVVCSYLLVKKLKVESDFRVIIYLFLAVWSLSLLALAVGLVRAGIPRMSEDLNGFYFSLLRGFAAVANLFLFYRWAGTKNMITRFWYFLHLPAILLSEFLPALFLSGAVEDYADFF